jgi:hypothetical protein
MDKNPIQDAIRRDRREQELGENPVCMCCGNEDFWALMKVPEKLLQGHHVAGQAHDPELTACICLNCHFIEHENLRREGVSLKPSRSFLERLAEILTAIGAFLRTLADRCVIWAEQLLNLVGILDRDFDGWREIPEAR